MPRRWQAATGRSRCGPMTRGAANRGNALSVLKRFDEATADYDRALALRPDYAEAHTYRGVNLHVLRRFDEALRFTRAHLPRGRNSPKRTTMKVYPGS